MTSFDSKLDWYISIVQACWSSGMILVQGTRGHGFDSLALQALKINLTTV